MFKYEYKEKTAFTYNIQRVSPLQKIQHEAKCGRQLFRIQMNLFTCFPFEPA